jgi:hypothetical protein
MAVIPSNLPQTLPSGASAVQSAQVKAAQAAFFRAALSEVQAAPARPQPQEPTQGSEPESPRLPRPGQLLDIRV